jgi:hypothetical protein
MAADIRGQRPGREEHPMSKPHAMALGVIALGTAAALLTACSPASPRRTLPVLR